MPSTQSKLQPQNPNPYKSNKTQITPRCPNCKSKKHIIHYGKRRTKDGLVQINRCTACSKNFTTRTLKYAQYPNHIILKAISTYNLGYTQLETINRINKRFKIKIPQPTLSTWLKRYSAICTFNRLRKNYIIDPKNIIVSKKFYHQQVYHFKYHKLKLNIAAKIYPNIKHISTKSSHLLTITCLKQVLVAQLRMKISNKLLSKKSYQRSRSGELITTTQ